jgi:hypothetical protein
MASETPPPAPVRHRPRTTTVFVAAFVAGAAAAVGLNRALDVHLAQAKPQVECEPIFVALRSLPQGTPVTVWDVALRDWPKAMLPTTALRVTDSFEGCLLKYPLREGQPLLAAQLLKAEAAPPAAVEPAPPEIEEDLVEEAFVPPPPAEQPPASPTTAVTEGPISEEAGGEQPAAESIASSAADLPPTTVAVTVTDEIAEAATATDNIVEAAEQPALDPAATAVADEPTEAGEPVAGGKPDVVAVPPEPAAVELSQRQAADQPTLAATPAREEASDAAAFASSAAAAPPPIDDRRLADDIDSAFDVPSRPAVDLASIPSVMANSNDAQAPAEDELGSAATIRYLVVPERIARQADTSFTTPVAPEGRPMAAPEQASVQPQAATAPQASGQAPITGRPADRSQAAAPAARRQGAAASQSSNRQPQPGSRQAQGKPQARTQQPQARTQQPQARTQQSQARTQQPQARTQQSQTRNQQSRVQNQQQSAAVPAEQSNPRAWGGMFPNVSAGLDAIGAWRGRVREAVVPERPAGESQPQRR